MIEIGVDIGGTFTDLVVFDRTQSSLRTQKLLTAHDDPAQAVMQGLRDLCGDGADALASVGRIVHGTTLVTNAVISRRGVPTGMLTTLGFRDAIEMRRENRQDLYDLLLELPEPLIPRDKRKEVLERVRADGSVRIPLDEADVAEKLRELYESDVRSVAVCLLHSFRNPSHERRIRELANSLFPEMSTSLSSEVAPVIREFERFSTTVINAYTQPIMEEYVARLDTHLRQQGLRREFLVMLSDGGVAPAETAARFPVRALESGPAAGMIAAGAVADQLGYTHAVGFDMGGTTAKICVIRDGRPDIRSQFEVARSDRLKRGSGFPVALPVIDMIEIGAGGGSIARLDALGLVRVGPDSAESHPGPACYGFGGNRPTVTDADLVLGYLNPTYFAGGTMQLDLQGALLAVGSLGSQLGLDPQAAAWAIHETVNEAMATALRMHLTEKGEDPRRYSLIAFGGAGPVHSHAIAAKLGLGQVIVPPNAGVESAIGLITSPLSFELARTHEARLSAFPTSEVNDLLRELETTAVGLLNGTRRDGHIRVAAAADMRYLGQTHTLTVPILKTRLPIAAGAFLRAAFETAYRKQFGRTIDEDHDVEAINWRVTASARRESLVSGSPIGPKEVPPGIERWIAFGPRADQKALCPAYRRSLLGAGTTLRGPLVIEEESCTTVVGPGTVLTVDAQGNLLLTAVGGVGGLGSRE